MTDTDTHLEVELTELNNRSRWYSSQLWQLPFAYLGLTAIVIGEASDKLPAQMGMVVLACAAFGILVLWHSYGAWTAQNRAIQALREVEQLAGIPEGVRARFGRIALPMVISVAVATLAYGIWAVQPLCGS